MKVGKIIRKNIKILLRSSISTLIIIVGPLLIIMLVGISFSTNTFNLHLGAYSEKYSNLSNEFIANLENESYTVTRYSTEDLCVEGVKEGNIHACIVFPPELEISNDQTSVIKFHVDQSKINLVYLVMSTLRNSFGEKTTELSKDLTQNIVTTLQLTKSDLGDIKPLIDDVNSVNDKILTDSESSKKSLDGLDFDGNTNLDINVDDIRLDLETLKDDTGNLIEDTIGYANDLDDYGGLDSNQSSYLNKIQNKLSDLNETFTDEQNQTSIDLNKFLDGIDEAVSDLNDKLDTAQSVSGAVTKKLASIKSRSEEIKTKSKEIQDNVNLMISNINAVQITNTDSIVTPISTEIDEVVQSQNNLGFLFPSLVVMLIMFIGLLLPSTLTIMEKNSRAYFRTFTTPTPEWLFILATFITSFILIVFQLIIILGVSTFYFKVSLFSSFLVVILALLTIITFFILLGMLIGYMFNTEEMAMLASVSISTLFLLTSGIIFPLESMPKYLIDKAKLNPMVLSSEMFKRSILFGAKLKTISEQFWLMILFSVIVVGLILALRKMNKLQIFLRKPAQEKIKKDWLKNQFDFGERKAKTLPEFIVSVQNMHTDRFEALIKQHAIRDWLSLVYRNKYLADKVSSTQDKKQILDLLVEELKKIPQQKQKKKKK